MKRSNLSSEPEGIGGWLGLFQVRMYIGIVPILVLPVNTMLAVLLTATLVLCAALFYLRCMAFRAAYIAAAAVGIAASIAALPACAAVLAVQAALEAAMIPALYRSQRVKNTFRRWRDYERRADIADGWNGRRQQHCCYDVYSVTSRCVR
jgi:hypothetical protein